MIKKNILFIFVFCLCLTQLNIAAIVSDNDGTAFVTKAEFDALKTNFNKQIDDYNKSIDGKIDGAIAQYLSGLAISAIEPRKAICYSADGIYNADKEAFKYNKGKMEWTYKYYHTRCYLGSVTVGDSELGIWMTEINFSDTPTEFKEMLINHPDYTVSNTAEWLGYCNTMQKLDTNDLWYGNTTGFGNSYSGTAYCYLAPVSPQQQFSTVNSLVGRTFGKWGMRNADSPLAKGSAYKNSYSYVPDSVVFVRTINATHGDNAILTVKNLTETRFSNNDGLHDFMNDDTTAADYSTYHVETDKFSDIADSVTPASTFTHSYHANNLTRLSFKINTYFFANLSPDPSISTWTRPYAGFDKKITDYNKLYTLRYDDYISDIKAKNGGASTGILKDKDGKEHLALFAGAPICELKNEEKIVLDLQFEDKTKDYDVWLKFSPFDNVDVWNDSCIDADKICIGISNTKAPAGSKSNSVKISNGVGQINWTADSNGIIFIKFAESGKAGLGAARLMMPNQVTVYKPT